jgi:hypothetical protein
MISDTLEGADQPPGSLTSSLQVVIYCFDVRIEILIIENLHLDIHEEILECDLYTCIWPASKISLQIPKYFFDMIMYISFLKSIIVFFFSVCQKMNATLASKLEADSGGWPGTGIKVTVQYSFMFFKIFLIIQWFLKSYS